MRPLLFAAGAFVLATAWFGPLPQWSRQWFSAHMLMHMAVVAMAAPLLAVGLAHGGADPARRWPRVFAPLPASALEFVVVWGWHAPGLHHAARQSGGWLALEQASFLAVGLLVWLAAFGGDRARRRERAAAGVAGLLLTSMHMALLGVLLALARRPLYPHSLHGGGTPFGLDAMADQQLGGVLMLLFGGTVYLAGALVLLAGLLRPRGGAAVDG